MPGLLLMAAALLGVAAWFLARVAVPLLLERTASSRVTPTLLQTLDLRVWTCACSAVLLAALALWRALRPAWRPAPLHLGLALAGVALLLRWATPDMAFNSIVRPDGVHFSVAAQQLVSHGTLRVPTGSALLPARTLPGPSFLQALTQWLRPDHPGYGIFAIWVCAALSLWLAFVMGRRFHGAAAGWGAVLLLALSPAHGWYSRQLMSEIPWGLLILASVGLLAGGLRRPGYAAWAGVLAGIGLCIKSSHLLIPIGMLLGMAAVHFRRAPVRPAIWLAFVGGLAIGSLPALFYNRLVLGGWLNTAYHIYWPGWASVATALDIKYLWAPPLINGTMGNAPYYVLALLGLDPRPERLIFLPGVLILLVGLLWRGRRHERGERPVEADAFQFLAFGAAGLHAIACLLYSFQEPRFFLPVVPLALVALAGPLARGVASVRIAPRVLEALGPVLLACLLGLGGAIVKVEAFSRRVPERQLLQQLAGATASYDVLVSDEDPVLLTTFGVWTDRTRVWPLLLPGELWFPDDPARLFREKGVAVEPFAGTVERVTQALAEGRSIAAYVRRPHTRPAAWTAFTNAFTLVPMTRGDLAGFFEVRPRAAVESARPEPVAAQAPVAVQPAEGRVPDRPAPLPAAAPVFQLGADMPAPVTARERSLPPHPVTLAPFELSPEEVDQNSYAAFLNDAWASNGLTVETNDLGATVLWTPGEAADRWSLCSIREDDPQCALRFDPRQQPPFRVATNAPADAGRLPMVLVSWPGAAAYCNWRSRTEGKAAAYSFPTNPAQPVVLVDQGGYRLPTEAEWEWVATWDGSHKRRYVWGDDWDPAQANLAESPRPERDAREPFTLPVDRPPPWRPDGAPAVERHHHLAGNVWEWCHDWFADYTAGTVTNPVGPAAGELKILRGGSFRTRRESAWAAFRGIATPGTMTADIGFRVARSTR